MNERIIKIMASAGLFTGGLFGMIGSFVQSPSIRGFAWGFDGVALILAGAVLTIYYYRKGLDLSASGFLIFTIGEGLILSSSGINLDADASSFGAGTGLWAAALFVISFQKTYPMLIRITGVLAAILFCITAFQILTGQPVNALTKPMPFYAYPIFVITIFGWAWTLLKKEPHKIKAL